MQPIYHSHCQKRAYSFIIYCPAHTPALWNMLLMCHHTFQRQFLRSTHLAAKQQVTCTSAPNYFRLYCIVSVLPAPFQLLILLHYYITVKLPICISHIYHFSISNYFSFYLLACLLLCRAVYLPMQIF